MGTPSILSPSRPMIGHDIRLYLEHANGSRLQLPEESRIVFSGVEYAYSQIRAVDGKTWGVSGDGLPIPKPTSVVVIARAQTLEDARRIMNPIWIAARSTARVLNEDRRNTLGQNIPFQLSETYALPVAALMRADPNPMTMDGFNWEFTLTFAPRRALWTDYMGQGEYVI